MTGATIFPLAIGLLVGIAASGPVAWARTADTGGTLTPHAPPTAVLPIPGKGGAKSVEEIRGFPWLPLPQLPPPLGPLTPLEPATAPASVPALAPGSPALPTPAHVPVTVIVPAPAPVTPPPAVKFPVAPAPPPRVQLPPAAQLPREPPPSVTVKAPAEKPTAEKPTTEKPTGEKPVPAMENRHPRRPVIDTENGNGCALPDGLPPARIIVPNGTMMRAVVDANMRRAPHCHGRVVDVLATGDWVKVLGYRDGWYRVTGQEWPSVWIGARLLAPVSEPARQPAAEQNNEK